MVQPAWPNDHNELDDVEIPDGLTWEHVLGDLRQHLLNDTLDEVDEDTRLLWRAVAHRGQETA